MCSQFKVKLQSVHTVWLPDKDNVRLVDNCLLFKVAGKSVYNARLPEKSVHITITPDKVFPLQ